jgi:hypothetical protein
MTTTELRKSALPKEMIWLSVSTFSKMRTYRTMAFTISISIRKDKSMNFNFILRRVKT